MATTSLWKVDKRLDHVIDYATDKEKTKNKNVEESDYIIMQALNYATNADKTEKQFFVSGINCEPNTALKQMIKTKKKFKKYKYSKRNKIMAFHGYQSFEEGEVTPEVAHEIGVKLAEEMWGDRFEVVVSTHLNTKHIHNHFVLNSVSFVDGKKYYSNYENTALLRRTSDDLCDEYGLKVLKKGQYKNYKVNFDKYYESAIQKSSYYTFAKEDIDYAIKQAWSYKQFVNILNNIGYFVNIRAGKISIRREPYKRNIRIERAFGEEYSLERIEYRILYTNPEKEVYPKPQTWNTKLKYKGTLKTKTKAKGLKALYLYYCYLLKVFPKKKMQHKLTPEMREAVKKMDEYSEQTRLLCKYNITTLSELNTCKNDFKEELQALINERKKLYYTRDKLPENQNKEEILKDIIAIGEKITKVRKKIKLCNNIEKQSLEKLEQIKAFEKRQKQEKEQKKSKKKDKKYER